MTIVDALSCRLRQDFPELVAAGGREFAQTQIINEQEIDRLQLTAVRAELPEFARFDIVLDQLMRFAVDALYQRCTASSVSALAT
ncbi:MAG: hypothetical protein V4550_08225 [Gemmatimonadota bacterium]